MKIKEWFRWVFRKIKFLVMFGIFLGIFILLEEAGGMKLILFVFLAYFLTLIYQNRIYIEEFIAELLYRMIKGEK